MTRDSASPLCAAALFAVAASCLAASAAPPRPHVTERQPKGLPDLVVHSVSFELVSMMTAANGTPCHLFNVSVDVANVGSATAGAFSVRLYRKVGRWREACATCTMAAVEPVPAGMNYLFPPRQFNDCGATSNEFRAIVDVLQQVTEKVESNNSKTATYAPSN
jgi:hypothetical protein